MKIIYQGEEGSNSHIACTHVFPGEEHIACETFREALAQVSKGSVDRAMIALENSIAGRVTDVHVLLPETGLKIIGEYFLPIRHALMSVEGATLKTIKEVYSHEMALNQCGKFLSEHNFRAMRFADTAGAAKLISEAEDNTIAALAPPDAAKLYGLHILENDAGDAANNTTRFVIMGRENDTASVSIETSMMAFVFKVRNIPAALYKALGGFATNGVNMTKLESYQLRATFNATQFYAEIEGHPDEQGVQLAMEELSHFTESIDILGVFEANAYRKTLEN